MRKFHNKYMGTDAHYNSIKILTIIKQYFKMEITLKITRTIVKIK